MNYELFYRLLYLCRRADEKSIDVAKEGKIRYPIHLSIGQESVSVALCCALLPGDVCFGTYRSHALYLAKGGSLKAMAAELYGKEAGCAKGKGGSMHLVDTDIGLLGTSGIVGTGLANAVGYAYGMKYRNQNNVVVCVFGDGAVDEGVFHESLNFAALKKLNVLFLCENNGFAIRSSQVARQSVCNIVEKARTYGIPAEHVSSKTDTLYERISATRSEMKENAGPRFIETPTCRWKEHLGICDDDSGYRDMKVVREWIENDELVRIGNLLTPEVKKQIEDSINQEVEEAFAFADSSPYPCTSKLKQHLFNEV